MIVQELVNFSQHILSNLDGWLIIGQDFSLILLDPLIEGESSLVIHREVPVPLCVIDDSRVIDLGDGFIHFLKSLEHEGYLREVVITLINLDFLEQLISS
jgi:hypothetical protein